MASEERRAARGLVPDVFVHDMQKARAREGVHDELAKG
jgi:hypothetical protein